MASYNPYQPPAATLDFDAPPRGAEDGQVHASVLEQLRATRPWVRFLSVFGYVSAGSMLLLGVGVMAFSGIAKSPDKVPLWAGLFYVALGAVHVPPSLYLGRYANAISDFLRNGSAATLEAALARQKSFWKLIGIFAIASVVLTALAFVGAVVAAVLARK